MKTSLVAIVLCLFAAPLMSVKAQSSKDEDELKRMAAAQIVRTTATVQAVDQENRIVTLKGPDGEVQAVRISDAVVNLPQLAAGDVVDIEYYEAVALDVKPTRAEPTATQTTAIRRAKPGEKPGGVATRKVHIVTEVRGVNKDTQSVLVTGPLGNLTRIKVNDPAKFAQLQTGGRIDVTYMEGLAIAVRAKPSK